MRKSYSLYEAKARFSAIVREVRNGQPVTLTVYGVPVAEIRPVTPVPAGIRTRLADLAGRGVLIRPLTKGPVAKVVARRPGTLARFLAERG